MTVCMALTTREYRPLSDPAQRFWSKVQKTETCWNWTGSKVQGYGVFSMGVHRRGIRAHRLSYEWAHGVTLPIGIVVCHHCDNPQCVRPEHLFVGTTADNVRDKVAKNRHDHGERHAMAKMTEAQAVESIRRYYAGGVTQAEIGQQLGIGRNAVSRLVNGRRWAHLRNEIASVRTRTGRQNAGLLHSAITPDIALAIFRAKGTAPAAKIAETFGVTLKIVQTIHAGDRWNDVTGLPRKPRRYRMKSA